MKYPACVILLFTLIATQACSTKNKYTSPTIVELQTRVEKTIRAKKELSEKYEKENEQIKSIHNDLSKLINSKSEEIITLTADKYSDIAITIQRFTESIKSNSDSNKYHFYKNLHVKEFQDEFEVLHDKFFLYLGTFSKTIATNATKYKDELLESNNLKIEKSKKCVTILENSQKSIDLFTRSHHNYSPSSLKPETDKLSRHIDNDLSSPFCQ